MNLYRKDCLTLIVSSLVFFTPLYASPPPLPQPRFDLYLLPPAPPEKIVEYPVITPSLKDASVKKEPEAVSEKSLPRESGTATTVERAPAPELPRETEAQRRPSGGAEKTSGSGEQAVGRAERMENIAPEVYARLNEGFSLAIEGGSWLFIDAYPSGGIAYDGRVREDRYMRFSFRAQKEGKYILQFVQGSSGGAGGSTHRVVVEVLSGEEFMARVTGETERRESGAEDSLQAEGEMDPGLSEDERYGAALERMRKGEWQNAFGVLTSSPDFDPSKPSRFTAAAFASALFMDDYMLALDYANFPASLQKDFSGSILHLGTELPVELRRRLLTASLDLLQGHHGMDELVFALAGDYEEPGPARDISEAVRWYRYLLSEYPLSAYWQRARERATYLERHFLLVR